MTNSYDVDHGLSQCPPGPLEPVELAQKDDTRIRVEVEPDPRGVSVGVWQGSHCIYSGAHPIPAPASPSLSSLHGLAPGACDGMKSEDYVNKVRNDDCSSPDCAAPASPVSTVEQGNVQDEIHALRQCAIKYLTWLGVSDPQASLDSDLRNPGMVNKPITMTHPTARDWKAINDAVKEYLDGYEMEGDGGYYVPNNRERAILDDAVAGLLADDDFLAHMGRPAPAAGDALDSVMVLPDGSGCALASFQLPTDHWLYAAREYAPGAEEPKELPPPILTHAQRDAVVAAIRYAVRGATMCGKEQDFDPDALVQNAVYALCGPYGAALSAAPAAGDALDAERWRAFVGCARIRPLGSAGLEQPDPNHYAHMGLEIWTVYGRDYSPKLLQQMDEQNERGRRWLVMFADVAIAAQQSQRKEA